MNISVITGGGGGMGKPIARELGRTSKVILVGRTEARLEQAKSELDYLGVDSVVFQADCSVRDDMERLAEYAASLGNVKNVIHTAGIDPAYATGKTIAKANAGGLANMVRAFFPVMAAGGVFISFASIATLHAPGELEPYYDGGENYAVWENHPVYDRWEDPDFPNLLYEAVKENMGSGFADDSYELAGLTYCATKRFTTVFTKRNTRRFAERGVRILCIVPGCYLTPMHQGMIDTQGELVKGELEMIPLKRWGHPYEMSSLVAFLCSERASFINGIDLLADGGQMASLKAKQIES